MRSSDEQRLFLVNAAQHLEPDGKLVVEMGVVNPQRWAKPQTIACEKGSALRKTTWNPVSQHVTHIMQFDASIDTLYPKRTVDLRVIAPNELLLMAELAGYFYLERLAGVSIR